MQSGTVLAYRLRLDASKHASESLERLALLLRRFLLGFLPPGHRIFMWTHLQCGGADMPGSRIGTYEFTCQVCAAWPAVVAAALP